MDIMQLKDFTFSQKFYKNYYISCHGYQYLWLELKLYFFGILIFGSWINKIKEKLTYLSAFLVNYH